MKKFLSALLVISFVFIMQGCNVSSLLTENTDSSSINMENNYDSGEDVKDFQNNSIIDSNSNDDSDGSLIDSESVFASDVVVEGSQNNSKNNSASSKKEESSQNSSRYDSVSSDENINMTIGQKNALKTAESYLAMMSFSKSGLIKQLEFEGYSNDDAVFAVDNCGADWKEQAVKKAKSYLDMMAFSKDGLIKQLEFEGFTNEEAVYGAAANGY